MPAISFDVNIGALLSPLFLIVLVWLVNSARKQVDKRVDERHGETQTTLGEIKTEVRATNGRVTTLETDHKADHDLLLTLKGSVDTLMGLRKGDPL